MTALNAAQLYKTLASVGFKKSHLKALLPEWWNEKDAAHEAGAWEMALLLARRLSIDVAQLARGIVQPTGAVHSVAFKNRTSQNPEELKPTSFIAASLAQALLASIPPAQPVRKTAAQVRNEILKRHVAVGFDELLDYCWSLGVPVMPLPHLPVGMRKMDGAILTVGDRPVIVLSRKQDSRAWISFILAHELGHFCCGHLQSDAAIVDVALKSSATYQAESAEDPQEREADQFALDLLGGERAEQLISTWSARASSVDLAVFAREHSATVGSSAGHLVLRYAFRTRRWMDAIGALAFLDEDFDAQQALVQRLSKAIDVERIAEDLREYLSKIVGLPG